MGNHTAQSSDRGKRDSFYHRRRGSAGRPSVGEDTAIRDSLEAQRDSRRARSSSGPYCSDYPEGLGTRVPTGPWAGPEGQSPALVLAGVKAAGLCGPWPSSCQPQPSTHIRLQFSGPLTPSSSYCAHGQFLGCAGSLKEAAFRVSLGQIQEPGLGWQCGPVQGLARCCRECVQASSHPCSSHYIASPYFAGHLAREGP